MRREVYSVLKGCRYIAILGCGCCSGFAQQSDSPHRTAMILWYRQPAPQWNQALPIGNGRMGAMVFGGANIGVNNGDSKDRKVNADIADGKKTRPQDEHLQLNEDTVWQGGRQDRVNPKADEAVPQIRKLLFAGQIGEAERLAQEGMLSIPPRLPSYSTLGDLYLRAAVREGVQERVTDYRRDLNLDTAIARVTYSSDDVRYVREMFASAVDKVIVVRLTANKPGRLNFQVTMDRPEDSSTKTEGNDKLLLQEGPEHKDNIHFVGEVQVLPTGGTVRSAGDHLTVTNADSVTLLIAAATDFKGGRFPGDPPTSTCARILQQAAVKPYPQLKAAHVADHQKFFRRAWLQLGADADPLTDVPTNERLTRVQAGTADPHLEMIYFQMGRYLMIASSRPGGMPENLQGLWASGITNPWGSKFTININTEMNYWIAEPTNLGDLHEPLFDLIDMVRNSSSGTGSEVATKYYKARGFVIHHNTDVWGDAVPVDGVAYGIWPMGGAWLSLHLWEHYAFTQDKQFLRERGYPVLHDASLFFLDYLTDDGAGALVTGPSLSPENRYKLPDGSSHSLTMAPTMDIEIVRELFTRTISASEILGRDRHFRSRLQKVKAKLPPFRIGKLGQLQEWREDYDETDPGHRHISHLWALFPGSQINPVDTPDLAKAAEVTLQRRLDHGGGQTGWSRAWVVNYWGRLGDGEKAYESLQVLLKQSTFLDLLDDHPPGVFQIDGNSGGPSGMVGMLLDSKFESQTSEIDFLPALPKAWKTGSFEGFRARGGMTVDLTWRDGKAVIAKLHATADGNLRLRAPHGQEIVAVRSKETQWPKVLGPKAVQELKIVTGRNYEVEFK
jgi:alpha-L-fucosidase 2